MFCLALAAFFVVHVALARFLAPRVPPGDVAHRVRQACDELLAVGDRVGAAFAAFVMAWGERVHQFGIDSRVCWNPDNGRVTFPFLEVQFGIGRIDPEDMGPGMVAKYRTPDELRARFGADPHAR